MKIGDLVVPIKPDKWDMDHWRNNETVGIVAEVYEGKLAGDVHQIWVRWFGHCDLSIEYSDGVEVISEAR